MEEVNVKMVGINDICAIFGCEKQKARKILQAAFNMKYASKVGKTTYMTEEDLSNFLHFVRGKKVII